MGKHPDHELSHIDVLSTFPGSSFLKEEEEAVSKIGKQTNNFSPPMFIFEFVFKPFIENGNKKMVLNIFLWGKKKKVFFL